MDEEHKPIFGKKVFFLYPPSVIQEEVVTRLSEEEYEIYLVKKHEPMLRLLCNYPDSLIFINLDEVLSESEWEKWIRSLKTNEQTAKVGVGILSYNSDEDLKRKYLLDLGIECGFIRMKLGVDESVRILLDTLKANEARGRRKYLRVDCKHDHLSTLNVRNLGRLINGNLRDISVVGFSCTFEEDPGFPQKALIRDIQLRLRGVLLKTDGIVFGKREEEGETVYVILFSNKGERVFKDKIRRYIQNTLQAKINSELGV